MHARQPFALALGLIIVLLIVATIFSLKSVTGSKIATAAKPTTSDSPTPAQSPSPSIPPISSPAPAPSNPFASIPILPRSSLPSLPITPPATLPAGWNKNYVHYQYANGLIPDYQGKPVVAFVSAGGKKIQLLPNQEGGFPRLFLAPEAQTQVILQFPQGSPGDRIGVSAVDGGYLGNNDSVEVLTLNQENSVVFQFTLSENQGVSRVAIRNGAQSNILDFWAGPDNQFPQLANTNLPHR